MLAGQLIDIVNVRPTAAAKEQRPFLLPLSLEPFRCYQYGKRPVHLDGCVEVEAAVGN